MLILKPFMMVYPSKVIKPTLDKSSHHRTFMYQGKDPYKQVRLFFLKNLKNQASIAKLDGYP
jgi:hypothetical protein